MDRVSVMLTPRKVQDQLFSHLLSARDRYHQVTFWQVLSFVLAFFLNLCFLKKKKERMAEMTGPLLANANKEENLCKTTLPVLTGSA